jgi:hypothetical protein
MASRVRRRRARVAHFLTFDIALATIPGMPRSRIVEIECLWECNDGLGETRIWVAPVRIQVSTPLISTTIGSRKSSIPNRISRTTA